MPQSKVMEEKPLGGRLDPPPGNRRVNSYILFHCEGYALSDTFDRIEIELLIFKLCPGFFGQSFSKLSSGCSSVWKSESP